MTARASGVELVVKTPAELRQGRDRSNANRRARYRRDPSKFKISNKKYNLANPEKRKARARRHYAANAITHLLKSARMRAAKHGLPFNLTREDIVIPDVCPALGIPLQRAQGYTSDYSPTLDRIVPALGYVKGNVAIISHRANRMKNDGTAAELELVARWLRSQEDKQ